MGEAYKAFESFYGGGNSTFEPDGYNSFINAPVEPSSGYRLNPTQIGFSANPMTGDQLGELQRGIRSGAKVIEVNLLRGVQVQGGGNADQVTPIQHFEEMRALSKLTGIKPSVHGPLVEASGFGERGWSKDTQEKNERIMFEAMKKAKIIDPDRSIPVTFHASNLYGGGGTTYKPGEKKGGVHEFVEDIVPIYNKEEKRLSHIQESSMYHIGGQGDKFETKKTIDEAIENQNAISWDNDIKSLVAEKIQADKILEEALSNRQALSNMLSEKGTNKESVLGVTESIGRKITAAQTILQNNRQSFGTLFHQAYKYGSPEQQKELKKMSDDWHKEEEAFKARMRKREEEGKPLSNEEYLLNSSGIQDKYLKKMEFLTSRIPQRDEKGDLVTDEKGKPVFIPGFDAPRRYVRGEGCAMEKAAESCGKVGAWSYAQLGKESAPVVAIENVWNGTMFSRGEDMKKLIEKSREEMVKHLVQEEGMKRKEAEKAAKEKIGMNLDVGHLNMFKEKGFTDTDIATQVKEVAPYIKHMHLTDNFGYSDEHLYPGQGNVPFKEIFTELKKLRPEIDKEVKMISETGGVEARHFGGRSAHAFTLAAFGVPIFGGDYWNGPTFTSGINTFGNYSMGYGETSPSIHHNFYGAGFTGLPLGVGAEIPGMGGRGGQSRFSGAPMA